MMKLLVEVKLNNSHIPNDPRQKQIIKMTQYGLCPTVPRSPLYRDDAFLLRCMSCANLILGTNIAYSVLKFNMAEFLRMYSKKTSGVSADMIRLLLCEVSATVLKRVSADMHSYMSEKTDIKAHDTEWKW